MQQGTASIYEHGTLVKVAGLGVLLQGKSGVGKSETALGLVAKGHRLIGDDRICIERSSKAGLIGKGHHINRQLIEIRDVGLINVVDLYGVKAAVDEGSIELAVQLVAWEAAPLERVEVSTRSQCWLGVNIPTYLLAVSPGRDLTLLVEAIALRHRAECEGLNQTEEFKRKLAREIGKGNEELGFVCDGRNLGKSKK